MLGDPRQLLGLRVVDQINLRLHPAQGSRGIVFGHGGGFLSVRYGYRGSDSGRRRHQRGQLVGLAETVLGHGCHVRKLVAGTDRQDRATHKRTAHIPAGVAILIQFRRRLAPGARLQCVGAHGGRAQRISISISISIAIAIHDRSS